MQLAKINIVCVYNTRFRGNIVCYLLKMWRMNRPSLLVSCIKIQHALINHNVNKKWYFQEINGKQLFVTT